MKFVSKLVQHARRNWIYFFLTTTLLTNTLLPNAQAQDIRVLVSGGDLVGNKVTNEIFANGDLTGRVDRPNWSDFRLLTTADIIKNYDVLVIPASAADWQYDSNWQTRIFPFLASGGGVVWEAYATTTADTSGLITGQFGSRYVCNDGTICYIPNSGLGLEPIAPVNVLPVAGLTDGISPDFIPFNAYFASWDPVLSPVLDIDAIDLGTIVYGLQGQYNAGRIVLTQSRADEDALKTGTVQQANSYNWLVNKIRWTSESTVEPDPDVRIIPDLKSYSEADMLTAMANVDLIPNVSYTQTILEAWGNVVSANPYTGNGAFAGDTIDVFVVDTPTGAPVVTPDVTGMTQADAEAAILAAGLVYGTMGGSHPTVPAGSVISQMYAPGTPNRVGMTMQLNISSGPSTSPPSIWYTPLADAVDAIVAAGYVMGSVAYESHGTVPTGYVIRNDNEGFTPGATIHLVVSSGPSVNNLISTPDTVGATLTAARDAVSNAGLIPLIVNTEISANVPAGDVISQHPVAGSSVAKQSSVNFVISSGPDGLGLVKVPVLEGNLQGTAEVKINDAGLVVGAISTVSSTTVPAGEVISSTPASATLVALNSSVDLVVSGGPDVTPADVPDVVGLAQADAEAAIVAAGLVVGTVTTGFSDTIPVGEVINQTPAAGTTVVVGDSVDLLVSAGPQPVLILVPNVVGLTQISAEADIVAAGLAVGTITTANDAVVPAGNVISQNPFAGSSVAEGSAVNLVISLGPAIVNVPNVVDLAQADAEAAIIAVTLTIGNVSYENSDTVVSGNVISQNPSAGTSIIEGSTVDLVISLGPALITVPDVVGDSYSTATSTIENAGLTIGNVSTVLTRRSCGVVTSQSPSGGTDVAPGSSVDLIVTRTRFCNPL